MAHIENRIAYRILVRKPEETTKLKCVDNIKTFLMETG